MKTLLILVLSINLLFAYNKGLGLEIKDKSGKVIGGYSGSYALLIGVSEYAKWDKLEAIPSEIEKIKKTLQKKGFEVETILNPNSKELESAYEEFIDKYGYDKDNRLLFFYSGHGYSRGIKKGYLVPIDAPLPTKDEKGFLRKALNMTQIITYAKTIEAKHALFLFDSCFSGTIFKAKSFPKLPPHIDSYTSQPVREFITAGSANEEVPSKSVFTPSFIRGVEGEADLNRDGYVTGTELGMYLHDKVLYYDTAQTPQYGKIKDPDLDRGDFVFFNNKKVVKNEFSFTNIAPTTFALNINVIPKNANIKVMNIEEKFHQGIELKKGKYDIEISKDGFITKRGWVELKSDTPFNVTLDRKKVIISKHTPIDNYVQKWNKAIYKGKRSYSKFSHNLVKDNYTGLIWQRTDDGKAKSWKNAKEYCSNLVVDGYSDFRLPEFKELYYLADRSKYNPAIDTNYFNLKNSFYWTNRDDVNNSSNAWDIYLYDGDSYSHNRATNCYVICIIGNTR